MREHLILFPVLSLVATPALADDNPRPDDHPPWSALTSSSAALKVVFEEVCVPAILERQPVEPLAVQRHLISVNPSLLAFPAT